MSPSRSPLPEDQGPTFEPTVHWCPRHLEPFRETWGQSAAWVAATLALFDECVRRREIVEAAGGDPRMLDRVLREFLPMCCYLGDEVTDRWTRLALGSMDEFARAHAELRAREPEA